jgi:hypothetical protein
MSHFAALTGSVTLEFIRDTLNDEAARREQNHRIAERLYGTGRGSASHPSVRKLHAIKAAADVFTHLIAEGQRATTDKKPLPEWLSTVVRQARASMVDSGDNEQKSGRDETD